MKKITIKVSLGVGYAGCDRDDELEFEVEDNATPEEIENAASEQAMEWAYNFIDIGFEILNHD